MSRKQTVPLYNLNGHFIRHISPAEATALYANGSAYLFSHSNGTPSGVRLIDPRREVRLLPNTAVTASEMEAYAGRHFPEGKSRTAHKTERWKHEREANGKPTEDFIERATIKIEAWR